MQRFNMNAIAEDVLHNLPHPLARPPISDWVSSDKYRVGLVPEIPHFVHMIQTEHVVVVLQ
jgi:hypothetical protein